MILKILYLIKMENFTKFDCENFIIEKENKNNAIVTKIIINDYLSINNINNIIHELNKYKNCNTLIFFGLYNNINDINVVDEILNATNIINVHTIDNKDNEFCI